MLEKVLIASVLTPNLPFLVHVDDPNGGFVGPSIDDFFPAGVLFKGTPFELNRVLLIRLLVVVVLVLVLWLGTRSWKLVPTRGQAAMEFVIDFVRSGIVTETLGEKAGKRFMPLLLTIFFLTLGLNATGT